MRQRFAGLFALVLFAAACGSDEPQVVAPGPVPVPATVAEAPPPGDGGVEPGDHVERLTTARDAWNETEPDEYTFRAQMFTGSFLGDEPDGCGAGGGTVAVTVVEGEVVSARNEDAACSIDADEPQRLPLTGDEIFERALKFAVAGPGAELTTNEDNFPENIIVESEVGYFEFRLIEFDTAAGSAGGGFAALRADLDAARDRWADNGFSDYTIETIRACECDIRPVSETVVDGKVVEGTGPGGVEGMFALIEQSIDAKFAGVDAVFDAETGAPIRISVDESLEIADDEFQIDVLSLIPAGANDVLLADVLEELGAQVGGAPDGALTLDGARYCGLDMVSFDREAPGANPIARRCLTHGASTGNPSVLVQLQPTIEGDPIVTVLRAHDDGNIDVHTDTSQDAFGSGGWSTFSCPAGSIELNETIGINYFTVGC